MNAAQLRNLLLTLVLGVGIISGCGPKPPAENPHQMPQVRPPDIATAIEIPEVPYPVIPNELVVLLKEGQSVESFSRTIQNTEIKIVGQIPQFRVVQIEVPSNRRDEIKEELRQNPAVESVVYQGVFEGKATLNDPVFHNEDLRDDWGLQAIHAEEAWEITRGDPNVLIGVVDGGMRLEHEELQGRIHHSVSSFTNDESHAGDEEDLFHGTHVAVIAAGSGDNGVGTSGVAPGCRLILIQVGMSVSDVLSGVAHAVKSGAKVINLSIGLRFSESYIKDYHDPSKRAGTFNYFLNERKMDQEFADEVFGLCELAGVTVITAAANDNLPADFNAFVYSYFTLGVAAVGGNDDSKLIPADFSNYGFMTRVSAPGVNIYSGSGERGGKGYTWANGTSVAAPFVAGLAGLIASVNSQLTPLEIRQILIASSYPEGAVDAATKRGKLEWLKPGMKGASEVDRWRRAFLLLMGKDESLLLDGVALRYLVSLIPVEANTVWEEGGQEKAVGGLIDARAALVMARDGSFRSRFAVFSDADSERAGKIDPKQLVRLYGLLKYRHRYAGSKEIPPFELKLVEALDRLEVIREQNPGSDYSEWVESIERGIYRHSAKLGDQDYSQGVVLLEESEGALRITNLLRKEDYSYPVLGKETPAAAGPLPGFQTIAGGDQPNQIGSLSIRYTGPKGDLAEEEFYVYPQGSEHELVYRVFEGKTGGTADLVTGIYDIQILSFPSIWIKGVVIEKGKTTELEAGGYGKILISGKDAAGQPVKKSVFLFASEDEKRETAIASGSTNEPLQALEGNYLVYVDWDPDLTYEDVRILRGQTVTIDLPARGGILVAGFDIEGKPVKKTYWVYPPGKRDDSIAVGYTNEPADLPPGSYDFYVDSNPDRVYEDVVVKPGETTQIKLPAYGALLVKGVDAKGKPMARAFYVYDREKKKELAASGTVNERLDIFAGVYDLQISLNPNIPYEAVKVEPGKVNEIVLPQWGEVAVDVKNKKGEKVMRSVRLYRSKEDKEDVVSFSDRSQLVPPGDYFIKVDPSGSYEDTWVNHPVKVQAGQVTEINVVVK